MSVLHRLLPLLIAGLSIAVAIAEEDLDESKAMEKLHLLGGRVQRRSDKLPGRPVIAVEFSGLNKLDKKMNDKFIHLLTAFKSLEELDLRTIPISDQGLEEIGKLGNLKNLISDAGLKEIGKIKTLRHLGLGGCAIGDLGLKELSGLDSLTELSIDTTVITDLGMKEVGKLKTLTFLSIGFTAVTDAGMQEIGELQNLQVLTIQGTKITNDGLKECGKLKKLRLLAVSGTRITAEGVNDLRAALPGLIDSNIVGP